MRRQGSRQTFALIGSATLIALGLVLFARVQPTTAAACDAPTKTFDGGAGSNLWNAAANWAPDGLPTSSDDVCLNGVGVLVENASVSARTFQVLSGASLSVDALSSLSVAGPSGSSVDAGASLSVAGAIGGGASSASPLTIAGTLAMSGTGRIALSLTNTGTITTISTGQALFSGTFTNDGTLTVTTGALQLNGTGSSSGSVVIAAGAVLNQTGGTFTYGPTATITGAGELHVAGATVVLSAGTTYGLKAIIVTGGTLSLNQLPNQPYTVETVSLSGGIINGPADLTVTKTLTMTGNVAMSGGTTATTTVASTANATISIPSGATTLGRKLSVASGATFTFDGNGTIQTGPTGNIGSIDNAGTMYVTGNTGQVSVALTNTGTIERKTATGQAIFSGTFTNDGTLTVTTGALQLNGTGSSSGSVVIAAGAVLNQTGGTFTYGPTATITGAGELHVAGATVVLSAGTTYGLKAIIVTGGTLSLNQLPNQPYTVETVSLSGGIINGPADLTVTKTLTMTGNVAMSGGTTATTTVASTANATISIPSGATTLGRKLSVASGATFTFDGNGTIQTGPTGNIGSIDNAGTMYVTGNTGQVSVALTNTGTIERKTATGQALFSGTFTNDGTLTVTTGALQLNGTGSSSGSVVIAAGAVLNQTGGTFTYGPTATITGAGELHVAGATVVLSAGTTYGLKAIIVTGGTLSLNQLPNQPYTVETVSLSGGIINGPADLTVTKTLTMTGNVAMSGGTTATTTVASTANATISIPSGATTLGRKLSVASGATFTFDGNGTIQTGPTGNIGSIDNAGTMYVTGNTGQVSVALTNTGTIERKTATGQAIFSGTFTNDGTLTVTTGALQLNGTGSSSGSVVIAAGAVLNQTGGTFTYGPTATITGAGELHVAGATVVLSAGTTYGLKAIIVTGGTLTLNQLPNQPYTVETVSLSGGIINGPADLTVTKTLTMTGNVAMSGGTTATTTVASTANATISIPSGATTLGRKLSVASGATFTFDGNGTIQTGPTGNIGSIDNAGTMYVTGNTGQVSVALTNTGTIERKTATGQAIFSGTFTNDGTLTVTTGALNLAGQFLNYNQAADVLSGGTYRLLGTLRFVGADIVTNGGAIIELNGPASLILDSSSNDGFRDFTTNAGTLSIIGGRTLTLPKALTNSGVLTVGSVSTLAAPSVNNSTGTLSGNGTVVAPVTNGGDVLPGTSPGILTITGSYGQTSAGTLEIEIGGTTPGSGHDQLDISGAATLGGTLGLAVTGGFAPSNGQTFTIMTYASHTGCFDTVLGRDLGSIGQGLFLTVDCGPTSAVVTAKRAEFSVDDVTVDENAAGGQLSFTISQNVIRPDLPTSVDWATSDGSAISEDDFASRSGTVIIPAGTSVLTATIPIDIANDALDEFDETFTVELSNPTNVVIADGTGLGTILDDDPPPLVSIDDVTVTEDDADPVGAMFTVSLSAPSGKPITVDYTTAGVSASAGNDFATATDTVSFAPGETTAQVTIEVLGDLLDEFDETFTVELSNPANVVIDDGSGLGTILDNDPPPTIAISDAVSVTEGNGGTVNATFDVSLSGPSGKPISIDYATADVSAIAGSDYVGASGSLGFAPGETTTTVTVQVSGDVLDEFDESFTVELTSPANVVIDDGSGLGTILDDDPPPTISIGDAAVTEGDSGTVDATFMVSLSGPSGKPIAIDYLTFDGPAKGGEDYAHVSDSLAFAPGETTTTVTVQVSGDVLDEFDETFTVELSNPTNVVIADGSGLGTIADDDPPPTVSISDATVEEGNAGTVDAVFTLSLSAPSGKPISVPFTTLDGTATAGEDYAAASGTAIFAPGDTTTNVAVKVAGDLVDEDAEDFTVVLGDPANVMIDDGTGLGTIADDDPPPTLSISNESVTEGNDGSTPMTFTVSLSGPSAKPISVDYLTSDDTATAGEDYAFASGNLIFAPGDTTAQVTVNVLGDLLDEFNERFIVDLTNASNATIAGPGTGVIRDDDAPPSLSIDDVSVAEGDAGTTQATFTVSLSAPSGKPISVDYATASESALAGEDYTAASGTLTFVAGDTSEQVSISVIGDLAFEPDETFRVDLSGAVNATIADDTGIGTINNDDAAVEISIGDATVTEGDTGTTNALFTVSLSGPSANTITVDFATADETAIAGSDYSPTAGALIFAPGETTKPLSVVVTGDSLVEPDETFRVDLSGAINATIADDTGIGTISNDDVAVEISIDNVSVAEGDAGTTQALFTVTLSEASPATVTVGFGTAGESALAGEDYTAAGGTLTFDPGDTSELISIDVIGDTAVEDDETFRVDLFNPVNAAIADLSGIGTITNDDIAIDISIDNVSVAEGDAGTSPATFTVTLSQPSSSTITVGWATLGTDALAGEDYLGASGVVTFEPGDTDEPITIDVYGDPRVENDETFEVQLANAVGATIADASGTGTILNDDLYADVSVAKTADHDATNPVGAGHRLVYTIAVTNLGPGPAASVQITDGPPHTSVPNDAAYCEVLSPATTCDTTVGTTYATATSIPPIATLASGETRTFQIGHTVNPAAPSGPMENIASISTSSTDANPFNDSSSLTVQVNAPPVASFTFSPSTPLVDETVFFDGTGSTDDGGIVDYAWAFGDGSTGTGATPTHAYTAAGSYVAQLTVTDALNRTSSTTRPVVVVTPSPPAAHRALRGTVSQVLEFGPGDPPVASELLAGATVRINVPGRAPIVTLTDAQGAYAFTNLTNQACPSSTCSVAVAAPGSTTALLQASVALGPDPSTIVRDFTIGTARDQLYVAGQVLPPFTFPEDPPPAEPLTVAIRVYRGNSLLVDSATLFGGPGGRGGYQFLVGRAGTTQLRVGDQLRIVLVENGVEGAQTTVQVPPLSGMFAPLVVTAADLVGQDPPPSAHRALRGTVSQVLEFGPGDPPVASELLAGATVRINVPGRAPIVTLTDAQGAYAFTNLTNQACPSSTCSVAVAAPGSTTALLQASVALGPDPSTIVRDFTIGTARDQLYVAGQVLPPFTFPEDPPPGEPLTVAIRVYRGNSLLVDSATLFGGPGGRGGYQFLVGRAGTTQLRVGDQLRIVLVENGVEGAQTTVQVPPLSGMFAPLVVTAADLVGQDPPPSTHRALRGTVSQVLEFGPGDPPVASELLAGATVRINVPGRAPIVTLTDAQGAYAFTNLTNQACPSSTCSVAVAAPGSTTALLQASVALGPDPSTIVRDFTIGTARDQLYVAGQVLPPFTFPEDPPPGEPLTVAIRVYRGNSLLVDSATLFGGPGGRGGYQFLVGRAGTTQLRVGDQLRIVLVENGVEGAQTTVQVPPLSGMFAPLVVTAADLVGT